MSVRPYLVCTYICRLSRVPPSFVCSLVWSLIHSVAMIPWHFSRARHVSGDFRFIAIPVIVPSFVVLVVFLRYLLFYAISLLWLEPKRPKQKKRQTNSPGNPGLQIERVPSVPVINFGKYFISMSSNASLSVQIILK